MKLEPDPDQTVAAKNYSIVWKCLAALIILQAVYAAGFIANTTITIEGQRYFCLFDDAMISMRYADNWAHGNGLVWNVGERVEGFTNPAWTIIMGLVHFINLSPSHTCLAVQIIGVFICWLSLVSVVILAKNCDLSPSTAICALCINATFYVFLFFTLFGMETGLLTCLVTFALASAVKCLNNCKASIVPMLWFSAAFLVRMDVLPTALFVAALIFIYTRQNRLHILIGLTILAVTVVSLFLLRHSYYGHWLPNTYYLKATNWPIKERILSGIRYGRWTFTMFIVPAIFAFIALLKFNKHHILLIGPMAILCAYQTYVGGDAWPLNRLVIPACPAFFVLAADGIHLTGMKIKEIIPAIPKIISPAILTTLCILALNYIHWDHWLLMSRPQTTEDNEYNLLITRAIQKISKPQATILVGYAGTITYFTQQKCFDLLGKCDEYIARTKALPGITRSGHNKYDIAYSIQTYKPDIIPHTFINPPPSYIGLNYSPGHVQVDDWEVPVLVRKFSDNVTPPESISWVQYPKEFTEFRLAVLSRQ